MSTRDQVLQRIYDYGTVFTSEAGKRVLDDLRVSFSRRTSHTPNDPYTTAFREGQRDVVLRIERLIEQALDPSFSPDQLSTLLEE